MIVDLRSDTVTKPTKGMLDAMFSTEVGDDVFGEDPAINALEAKAAAIFGKEAGIFCPSGTQTNQIAINILTHPQEEMICDVQAHVYKYEAGGPAFHSRISVRTVNGHLGRLSPQDVVDSINPENAHFTTTSLVSVENTSNRGGGSFYALSELQGIGKICAAHGLKYHLDGARIFNALAAGGYKALEVGKLFDTVSVCLSKGLGAPVGSVLLSTKENIKKAKKVRKVMGGGMRQAGFLAAAGIYALDHHIERLKDDHDRAKILETNLKKLPWIDSLLPVSTNIIIFKLHDSITAEEFLVKLSSKNIKAAQTAKQMVRFVTHLDFNDDMMEYTIATLNTLYA